MDKKGLIKKTSQYLRENGLQKHVLFPAQTYTVYNIDGTERQIRFEGEYKIVPYNTVDVRIVLNALLDVIVDAIRLGDDVRILGFGRFFTKTHKARQTVDPHGTGQVYDVPAYVVPKFECGTTLKMAAKACGLIQKDNEKAQAHIPEAIYEDLFDDMDDDEDDV